MFKIQNLILVFSLFSVFSTAFGQLKIGDKLPEIQLQNNKDVAIDLQSYQGKVVLVDFWASWCAPCRVANKRMAPFYNQYKSKQFEVVAISVDTDKLKWTNAIAKDKLEYVQLLDPNGFDAKSAVLFGVEQLPSSYLFDTSGALVMINPTEEEIVQLINKK
ncbi:MAG: TlpA family protein disulfide reductase [Bacteroidetes bacterium]|jgi:peroxiredoxin|nr:TlpA family protein disulfide reductase [Bacteroidota bacterium]